MPPKKLSGIKIVKENNNERKSQKKQKNITGFFKPEETQTQLTENNSQLQLSLDSGDTSASSFEGIPSNLNNQQPKTNLELTTVSEQNLNENFKYNDPGTWPLELNSTYSILAFDFSITKEIDSNFTYPRDSDNRNFNKTTYCRIT